MAEEFRKQLTDVQAIIGGDTCPSPLWAWYEQLLEQDSEDLAKDRLSFDIEFSRTPVSLTFSTRHQGLCLRVCICDLETVFRVRTDLRIGFDLSLPDVSCLASAFIQQSVWPRLRAIAKGKGTPS